MITFIKAPYRSLRISRLDGMTAPMARVKAFAQRATCLHYGKMIRISVALCLATFALSACAPLTTYYKPGVSVSRLDRDTTACKVRALRDVPSSTVTKRYPPEYIPPVRECNAAGKCHVVRAGYYRPGETFTYDPNDKLRRTVEQQCMADKGYGRVSIQPCPGNVANATPARSTTRLPQLTPTSCVIRNSDGSFQIVNRG